jgi:hypothetical protein
MAELFPLSIPSNSDSILRSRFLDSGEKSTPVPKTLSSNLVGVDVPVTCFLAARFDPGSMLATLPIDIIKSVVSYFVPSVGAACRDLGYLLPRPISRSYYQICRMIAKMEEDWEIAFTLSLTRYEPNFVSGVQLVRAAPGLLKFLIETQARGIIFKNYSKARIGKYSVSSKLFFSPFFPFPFLSFSLFSFLFFFPFSFLFFLFSFFVLFLHLSLFLNR